MHGLDRSARPSRQTTARGAGSRNLSLAGLLSLVMASVASVAAQADVTISSKPTKNISCNAADVCTPTKKSAVLNVNDLENMLSASSVTITTGAAATGIVTNDIIVNAALSWASGSTLTLDAHRSITVNQPVSDTGAGGLTILTNDGGSGGRFSFARKGSVAIWDAADPLIINNNTYSIVYTLAELVRLVTDNPAGHFALGRPYDASGDGTYPHSPIRTAFRGTFEGLGNRITKLSLANREGEPLGLFEHITKQGTLKNLELLTVKVNGSSLVGGFAALNQGLISGQVIDGTVDASANDNTSSSPPNITVGGLVGENDGTITFSRSTASVTATVSDKNGKGTTVMAGGLVGFNNGLSATIHSSWAGGPVSVTVSSKGIAHGDVGGLVGKNVEGSINGFSFAVGSSIYSGDGSGSAGGLVGTNDNGTILDASASGAATGGDLGGAGGLIGTNENVINCSCGSVEATVATGAAKASVVGGSIGYNSGIPVSDSTASGLVIGGQFSNHSIGGFVGVDQGAPSGDYSNDSWNETTTGINDPSQGAGNFPNDPGITGTQ
jgi:hypothetical protein